ncbi:MAG: hypothetical protein CMI31_04065 [Opitutae bacterium]|nr:hypothetical protein [Opitutae bacterium]
MKFFQSIKSSSKFLLTGIALLTTIAAGSLGIVWLRVEISRTAEDSRKLEKEVAENARELRGLNAKRAKELNPSSLKALVGNRLSKPKPSRVFFVKDAEFQRRQSLTLPHHFRQRRKATANSQPLVLR